ncbi:MAG TPA: MBL fold metallo-hydrolase [Longimicrobiales bacterium]|nr:MBL fold metallo-hydrolase [Longimicrobiales bacterium]
MSGGSCVDLLHLGLEGAIGCYLIDAPEPTLVDPGPSTTLERLAEELKRIGLAPRDLRHVLLTHIHLDHAGATGELVERFPEAVVHVHEDGAPHLEDPERLVASTRRTFGDAHDRLWGRVRPVPADRIRPWRSGDAGPWPGLRALGTPGHIAHHLAYLDERYGTLYSGDAMGVVLSGAPPVPPTPPPAVDLVAWLRTLEELRSVAPERFGATHFGFRSDFEACRSVLHAKLEALEARVRRALDEGNESDAEAYDNEVRRELAPFMGEDRANRYCDMFSGVTDWAGVAFYIERKS